MERAEAQASLVRAGFRRLLNDPSGDIALGQNTHELVTRLLSALPLASRRTLISTDGEFHTIRRQLDRLKEENVTIVTVPARPADTLADRLAAAVDDRVACVLVSSVLYETAEIVPGLAQLAKACTEHGATLLVDAYHHLNVVPFDMTSLGLDEAFVTGGGYKYCQLGEGNAFLRLPANCSLRPVLTGWFSEFGELQQGEWLAMSILRPRRGAICRCDLRSNITLSRGCGIRVPPATRADSRALARSAGIRSDSSRTHSSGSTPIRISPRSSRCLTTAAQGSWRSTVLAPERLCTDCGRAMSGAIAAEASCGSDRRPTSASGSCAMRLTHSIRRSGRQWMKLQEVRRGTAGALCHFACVRPLDDAEQQADDQITP